MRTCSHQLIAQHLYIEAYWEEQSLWLDSVTFSGSLSSWLGVESSWKKPVFKYWKSILPFLQRLKFIFKVMAALPIYWHKIRTQPQGELYIKFHCYNLEVDASRLAGRANKLFCGLLWTCRIDYNRSLHHFFTLLDKNAMPGYISFTNELSELKLKFFDNWEGWAILWETAGKVVEP